MDILKKILEQFGAFFQLQEQLTALSKTNPVLAGIVIFIIAIVVTNVIVTQAIELKNKFFGQWRPGVLAWAGLGAGLCLAALISAGTVLNLSQATAPPVFDKDIDIVIGRRPILKWKYPNKNARFEIQSSEDPTFLAGVETYTADAQDLQTENINGKRFWRVREIDASDQPVSPWSQSIPIIQYETTLKRIQATRSVSVYTSSSINEGFFKFDVKEEGKRITKGYDIEIIDEIVRRLPPLLDIDGPLKQDIHRVKWRELLDAPKSGADVIISSITSFQKREDDFSIKFSAPYYCTTQSLIYRPSQSSKSVLETIEHRKVGVQGQTTSQDIMRQFKNEIPEDKKFELREDFDHAGDLVNALMKHEIDVVMTDTPFARAAQWQNGTEKLALKELTKDEDFPRGTGPEQHFERYAIAVRDDETRLINAINRILGELREEKLTQLLEKAVKDFFVTKDGSPRNLPMFDRKKDPSHCGAE